MPPGAAPSPAPPGDSPDGAAGSPGGGGPTTPLAGAGDDPARKPRSSGRRHDLDALRVGSIALVALYHAAAFYSIFPAFYIEAEPQSAALTLGLMLPITGTVLTMLFLVSGYATGFGRRRRTNEQYVRERFTRLGVPLVFGTFALNPILGWIGFLHAGGDASFLAYLPRFFHFDLHDMQGYRGAFSVGHLWFLLFLFVFSLAAAPLLTWLESDRGRARIEPLVAFFARGWNLYLIAIPALVGVVPFPGGKNPVYYFGFFLFGYLLAYDPRWENALRRTWRPALALGVLGMAATSLALLPGLEPPRAVRILAAINYRSTATHFMMLGLLGLARDRVHGSSRAMDYASEIAYPFYILHLPAIVVAAHFVLPLGLHPWLGCAALYACCIALSVALYEAVVKRTRVTRFLFGMR